LSELTAQSILGSFADSIAHASGEKPWRLGILGGTFDPVHFGHLLLAQSALEQFGLDGVLLVPTAYPFYKQAHLVSDVEERFHMLKLAIGDDQRFQASRVEIDREGPSFTVDTLDILSLVCAEKARFFLIVGADALLDLSSWKGAVALAKQVTVLYADRPGTSADLARQATINSEFDIRAIEQPLIEISSSALRARVAKGLSIRYYTPLAVADFFQRSYREHALVSQQVDHRELEPTSSHPTDNHAKHETNTAEPEHNGTHQVGLDHASTSHNEELSNENKQQAAETNHHAADLGGQA